MIQQYQKKPVAVDAAQLTPKDASVIQAWCGGQLIEDAEGKLELFVHTLEGTMKAVEGDYIIRGIKGEFYPCRKDIFEESYEMVH